MNVASWIILAVVVAIAGLAVKATFFGKKKSRGGCCDVGDTPATTQGKGDGVRCECASSACAGCSGCAAVARNAAQPIIREQGEQARG